MKLPGKSGPTKYDLHVKLQEKATGRNRRKYNEDFQRTAVNRVISSGKSVAETAADPGIKVYKLSRWKDEFL